MLNSLAKKGTLAMKSYRGKLSPRLTVVADFVPRGAVVADIGTDHAYLPVYLVENGICPSVVATDVHQKPYQSALNTVGQSGLGDRIKVRLGDGLNCLQPGDVQVVIMAGMGGKTMCRLLEASPGIMGGLRRLILQPMDDAPQLREWLVSHSWHLVAERLVDDNGHLYQVLVAEPGRLEVLDELALLVGPRLLDCRDELMGLYVQGLIDQHRRILEGLSRSNRQENREREKVVRLRLKDLKGVLEQCQQRLN